MTSISKFYLNATGKGLLDRPPAASQSAVLPVGTNAQSLVGFTRGLSSAPVGAVSSVSSNTLSQTAHQDGCIQGVGWVSDLLAAQTISSGTWTFAAQLKESDGNANAFLALSAYVYRPETSTLVGYIYDSDTPLGNEWGLGSNGNGQVITFSGNSVSGVQARDVLVIEVWFHASQATAAVRSVTLFLDGTTDATAGSTSANSAAYIQAPSSISMYDGIQIISSGATSASSFAPTINVGFGNVTGDLMITAIQTQGSCTQNSGPTATLLQDSANWTSPVDHLTTFYRIRQAGDATSGSFNVNSNPATAHTIILRNVATDVAPINDFQKQNNSHVSGTGISGPAASAASGRAFESIVLAFNEYLFPGNTTSGTSPPSGYREMLSDSVSGIQFRTQETSYKYFSGSSVASWSATANGNHTECVGQTVVITAGGGLASVTSNLAYAIEQYLLAPTPDAAAASSSGVRAKFERVNWSLK